MIHTKKWNIPSWMNATEMFYIKNGISPEWLKHSWFPCSSCKHTYTLLPNDIYEQTQL